MNKLKFIICIFLGLTLFSCNEAEWLKEKPYDFYAPDNSFETVANFKQAMNYMYELTRHWFFRYQDEESGFQHHMYIGGDLFYHGWPADLDANVNRYDPYINSTNRHVIRNWAYFYNIISSANTILSMLETNASEVPEGDKLTFRGQALFFRAYYYRWLAHMWGDVPIITEMLSAPKTDFERSPRDEVYQLCQEDLEEAVRLLDDIDHPQLRDGEVNKQLAQHVLAEVYISRGNYTQAIAAAEAVINHSAMGLMTERFGAYENDDTKDVFFDLFRAGNTNRARGNTEGLWVIQYDYLGTNPQNRECNRGRYIMPQLRTARVSNIAGDGTVEVTNGLFTAENGGRGNGYFPTTHHFRKTVWASDYDNDIRNSSCNIFRDYRIDNVSAAGHGQWIVKDGWLIAADTFTFVYPAVTKFCAFEAYPDNSYAMSGGARQLTPLGQQVLVNSNNSAIGSFKDEYLIRLAETYLLLAEAYIGVNQLDRAAEAVNVVRARAKANPATAAEMNIDYILDERIRELCGEEVRNVTLFRTGKFIERARKYSPTGHHVGSHQTVWPIPFSEIEKNTGAVLTQNQGY